MKQSRERVVRGRVRSEHLVQLFDDVDSLTETLSSFLYEGWQRGDTLLVVARPEHWAAASPQLDTLGCPVRDAIASGRLVVLDAATTLASFVRNNRPNKALFEAHFEALVRRISAESERPLRVYGEMVDILAAQGELEAAQDLENMWNELGTKVSYTLLCGYASAHFGDARTASALRAICDAHDHASAKPTDLLGAWLLADRRPGLHPDF